MSELLAGNPSKDHMVNHINKSMTLHGAKVYRATTFNVPNDTFTQVTWDATSFSSPATIASANSGGLTIAKAGYYDVIGQAAWDNNYGSREMSVVMFRGGVSTRLCAQAYDRDPASTEPYEDSSVNASTVHWLQPGDLIYLLVHQKSEGLATRHLLEGVGKSFLCVARRAVA